MQKIFDIGSLLARLTYIFLILFSAIYYFGVSIKALILQLIPVWEAFFEILLGTAIILIFLFFYCQAYNRIGHFGVIVGAAFWIMVPCNWIIGEWELLQQDFIGTYVIMWIITIMILVIAIYELVTLLIRTIELRANNQSIAWGPGFKDFKSIKQLSDNTPEMQKIKKNIGISVAIIALTIPGILPMLNPAIYPVTIEIIPGDQEVTFNFWATWNTSTYSNEELEEMNKYKVNLDLTFGHFEEPQAEYLKEWEAVCPNITYRIVIHPENNNFSNIYAQTIHATEIMLDYETNGTLDQWRGFCYDIEGDQFRYNQAGYESLQGEIDLWNSLFDYIDYKSEIRGKTIEMESVSDWWTSVDFPFDGDADIQQERKFCAYYPERFTIYAPMIYRCWYEGTQPFGSEMNPDDPWSTSYEVYSQVHTLAAGLPENQGKVGTYLGITNCSCYGRDLAQPEPISWGEPTGFMNLVRDTLICKSFGMTEITFFLAWTAMENGYSMGGVFESYGIDFLERMDAYVNGDEQPDSFEIYFRYDESTNASPFKYDWVYDFSRPIGMIEVFLMVLAAIYLVRRKKT